MATGRTISASFLTDYDKITDFVRNFVTI